jgi:predicted transcriptional regulator
MASVLRVAMSGRPKTYIMRKCNLSYRQLQAYLEILLDKGLLEVKSRDVKGNPAKIFATTQKGQTFAI